MNTIVDTSAGIRLRLIRGNGDWYMLYIGDLLVAQFIRNKGLSAKGYYTKTHKVKFCEDYTLDYAVQEILRQMQVDDTTKIPFVEEIKQYLAAKDKDYA